MAVRTALQYHWGSLCFGAMANMVLKPVRLVLRLIMLLTKSCGISSVKRFYKRMLASQRFSIQSTIVHLHVAQ
jgi:hypothetical protein